MKNIPYPRFTIAYLLLSLVVIGSDYFSLEWTYYLSKPLVLVLIYFFFRTLTMTARNKRFKNLMLAGFLFSSAGDFFLMLKGINQNYFLIGLIAFLAAHILYSSGFIIDILDKRPWTQHWGQLAFSTLIVVYGAEFFILNRTSFADLYFPIMIYCFAIAFMGVSAVMRDKYKNQQGYFKVLAGAVFFIISDSLLATNTFISPFPFSGTLILSTYFIAQYLIATGCLLDLESEKKLSSVK
ncbi:MAG: lysoplasmalogenase [Bacteroidetes bacterium]|nr:lysoplasmalogenase [Bacteroidota bacterium]